MATTAQILDVTSTSTLSFTQWANNSNKAVRDIRSLDSLKAANNTVQTKMAVANTLVLVATKMSVANTLVLVATKMSVANTNAAVATKLAVSNANALFTTKAYAASNTYVNSTFQPVDADLTYLASLSSNTGFVARTGLGTFAVRSIVAPAAGISVSQPAGGGGNPTISLANDLNALEGLSGTGIAVRTGADTWVQRILVANTGIVTTNPTGVAGNINIAADIASTAQIRGKTSNKILAADAIFSAADFVNLTYAATVLVNMGSGFNFNVGLLTSNLTLSNPANTTNGQSGSVILTQDATGGRTVSFGTNWKFAGGTAPVMPVTASARGILHYKVVSSTNIICSWQSNI